MKNRLLIFTALLLSLYSFGQPSVGFMEAVIIKKNGDSLKCLVEMLGGYDDAVVYKLSTYDKEIYLRTKEIFKIITDYKTYDNVKVGKKERILPLMVDGPIRFYKSSHSISFNPSSGSVSLYDKPSIDYVIKSGEDYIEIKEKNYKELLSKILDSCKNVVQKLKDNIYKFTELEKAVEDYYNCNQPEIPEEKYDIRFLGNWHADSTDLITKNNMGKASMRFDKGYIVYWIVDEKKFQTFNYNYVIRGDSIISIDPVTKEMQITKYRFDANNKLILETNGVRSVFIRK